MKNDTSFSRLRIQNLRLDIFLEGGIVLDSRGRFLPFFWGKRFRFADTVVLQDTQAWHKNGFYG
jgi:hypothetical protein